MRSKAIVGIVVLVVIAVNASFLFMGGQQSPEKPRTVQTYLPKVESRGIIRINSDADFDSAHGVVSGDGSVASPYRISGWSIDGGGKGIAIYIGNTTKNFTIDECELYNATGGNFDSFHQNAGITLYHVKATTITIQNTEIHDNDGGGIVITYPTIGDRLYIGHPGLPNSISRIFYNARAGIYISHASHVQIIYNNIFSNSYGIQFSSVNDFDIEWNGVGKNTHQGIYIYNSQNGEIYSNVIYENNGAISSYNSSATQAYVSSSSNVVWYDATSGTGNFWYDWAYNNNTNFDRKHGNFVIPWAYRFSGGSDPYPMKGIHHRSILIDQEVQGYDDMDSFNIGGGVVGGNGFSQPFVIMGWEISDEDNNGYGIMLNNNLQGGYIVPTERSIRIDGVILHNISSASSPPDWRYMGNGLVINGSDEGIGADISIRNLMAYSCHANGLGIAKVIGNLDEVTAQRLWLYDNDVGAYLADVGRIGISDSTIDSNHHWGVFIGGNHAKLSADNVIFEHNYAGINMPSGLEDLNIYVQHSSFFENDWYAASLKNSTFSKATFEDNVFYNNNGATDHFDPGHVQMYAEDFSNFSSENGNYFHDWVNNNRTNDANGDGIIDYEYPLAGGGVKSKAVKWADFDNDVYLDDSNRGFLGYYGTKYGFVGYDGSTYYIVGWNVTYEHGTQYPDGMSLVGDSSINLEILNCHVGIKNVNTGIYAHGFSSISIGKTEVNGASDGVFVDVSGGLFLYDNVIHHNYNGAVISGSSSLTSIYDNRIYSNTNYGLEIMDIQNTWLGVYVYHNTVFQNREGIYTYELQNSPAYIYENGIAYNQEYGVDLFNTRDVTIYNNTFYWNNGSRDQFDSRAIQAYDSSGNNQWNNTKGFGNYWHDWSLNNDTNDRDYNYIVDYPYRIGGSGVEDRRPQLYIAREPIRINNLGDLDWEHGYIGGDGVNYPYTMAGWRIKDNVHGYGIYVGNLSGGFYFKMDNCLMATTTGGNAYSNYFSDSGIIIYNTANWDFKITHTISGYNDARGLYIYNSWDITIENSYFQGNHWHGIHAYNSHYIAMYDTNMSDNGIDGFMGYNTDNIILELDILYNNGDNGAFISYSQNSDSTYGYIEGNIFKLNTNYGLKLYHSSGFTIYGNTFYRNNGSSSQYDSHHIQAYDDESTEYTNHWNTTSQGNCWKDWPYSTPYQIDPSPYVAKDHKPYCNAIPEFQGFAMAAIAVLLIVAILRRRKLP